MKRTRTLNSFFLIPGRDLVKNLLAFFRFTETDACALLSAYGIHSLAVDRLQNTRSNEQKETGSPMQIREPISAPRSLKPAWTHRSNKPDQSPKDSPIPTNLDTALAEIAEEIDFDWQDSLLVESPRWDHKNFPGSFPVRRICRLRPAQAYWMNGRHNRKCE